MRQCHARAKFIATSILILLALPISGAVAQIAQDSPSQPRLVSAAQTPHGTETLKVEWIKVAAPSSGIMLAAVARPPGSGPFPTIILLHGTHGFAQEYVHLARDQLMAVCLPWRPAGFAAAAAAAPGS